MEKSQTNTDIVNVDFVPIPKNSVDIDNAVEEGPRVKVLRKISEYKLDIIHDFIFGGANKNFSDNRLFVTHAIKQVERFTYTWYTELDDESRKLIINYTMGSDSDFRSREYKEYLSSPIWKFTSSLIKFLRGYTCEICKETSDPAHLVVHHRNYEHLGSELAHLEDVMLLCNYCHMKEHGIGGKYESRR